MNAGSADRREADRLLRLLVRQRESCERCGQRGEQVAHIIGRRANATRCDERNVWFLCAEPCHRVVDSSRGAYAMLIEKTPGWSTYEELLRTAQRGPQGPLSAFWADEVERLRKRLAEEGIDP